MRPQEEVKGPVYGTPMYVALVDVCAGDDYLELVKSALQAALEAMPAGSLFGLITFSSRVRASRGLEISWFRDIYGLGVKIHMSCLHALAGCAHLWHLGCLFF